MLKIHSDTKFSQTHIHTHTRSVCGTLYVPLQKRHVFFSYRYIIYIYCIFIYHEVFTFERLCGSTISTKLIDMMMVMILAYSKSTDWKCESFQSLRSYYNFACMRMHTCVYGCVWVSMLRICFVYSLCSITHSMLSLSSNLLRLTCFLKCPECTVNLYVCGMLKGCLCHMHHSDFERLCVQTVFENWLKF